VNKVAVLAVAGRWNHPDIDIRLEPKVDATVLQRAMAKAG